MKIHLCNYASQPDIKYACGKWTLSAWAQPKELPPSVYLAEDNDYYTFDDKLYNCVDCKLNA